MYFPHTPSQKDRKKGKPNPEEREKEQPGWAQGKGRLRGDRDGGVRDGCSRLWLEVERGLDPFSDRLGLQKAAHSAVRSLSSQNKSKEWNHLALWQDTCMVRVGLTKMRRLLVG